MKANENKVPTIAERNAAAFQGARGMSKSMTEPGRFPGPRKHKMLKVVEGHFHFLAKLGINPKALKYLTPFKVMKKGKEWYNHLTTKELTGFIGELKEFARSQLTMDDPRRRELISKTRSYGW